MWRPAFFLLALLLGLLLPPASAPADRLDSQVDGIYARIAVSAEATVVAEIEETSPHTFCQALFLHVVAHRSPALRGLAPQRRHWTPATGALLRLIGRQNE